MRAHLLSLHCHEDGAIAWGYATHPIERYRIIREIIGKSILSCVTVYRAIKDTLPVDWVGAT